MFPHLALEALGPRIHMWGWGEIRPLVIMMIMMMMFLNVLI